MLKQIYLLPQTSPNSATLNLPMQEDAIMGEPNRMLSDHKDTSFMRSPLANRSQCDQRFFGTETKMAFKNISNTECKNFGGYSDFKAPTQKYNNENAVHESTGKQAK